MGPADGTLDRVHTLPCAQVQVQALDSHREEKSFTSGESMLQMSLFLSSLLSPSFSVRKRKAYPQKKK